MGIRRMYLVQRKRLREDPQEKHLNAKQDLRIGLEAGVCLMTEQN